ncbi:snake venom 5'-nucleotidase isoform X2 [Patella vulgata]|nr:snake venom 5'-nucleotidase isoform X2 [Patella vulgata]
MNPSNMDLLILLLVVPVISAFNLTILHTNDVHARFEETNKYSGPCTEKDLNKDDCFGGYPRIISKIKDLKSRYPNTLVLDGGDQYQGTTWFYHFGGNVTSYFMNYLEYDAMAIGNHEFDNAVSGLVAPFLEKVNFPVLSANIDASQEPTMQNKFNKSVILTVAGEKIAVIGYTTTDTPSISSTGKLIFNDEVESVRNEVATIKGSHPTVNKFIALGHAGFTKDKRIAEEVEDIDIVVGGHTNTFLYSGEEPSNEKKDGDYPFVVTKTSGKKAVCVQDYAYGKYLGFLHVEFDDDGNVNTWMGNPILLNSSIPKDNATLVEMRPWKQEIQHFKKSVVGETRVLLQGDSKVCRKDECNLGNAITDGILRYNLNERANGTWNNVSIVLMNSGGIRSPIEQGDITIEQVLTVMPFRNTIDRLDMKGVHLKATLEHSVSLYGPDLAGRFLQFSGLRVKYNVYKPVGQRVISVKVQCIECDVPEFEDLNEDKVYSILIPAFVANGGDAYDVIVKNKMNHIEKGDLDATVFNKYLEKFSPIIQGLDGRIEFETENTEKRCPTNAAHKSLTYCTFIILSIVISLYFL